MVKRLLKVFFFESYNKWIFFMLVQSYSISPVCVQCIMERALFLHYFFIISIDHLFDHLNWFWRKEKIVLEKVRKKSWILDPKICVNPDTNCCVHTCTPLYIHVHGTSQGFLDLTTRVNSRILKKVKRRWCYIHANFYLIFLPGTTSWQ